MPTNPRLDIHLEDDNFISKCIAWASKTTDSYLEYQFAAALFALSTAAQRNAVIRLNTGDIYPNIWCFLLGASSISRKSTSIKLLKRIVQNPETEKHQLPKSFSPETLVEYLDETSKGYYINVEAAGFLKSFKKRYMEDVLDMLCDLYDGDSFSRRLTVKKSQKMSFNVPKPYITKILATTPENFECSCNQDYFTYGLFYRFLWFYPNYSRDIMKLSVADPTINKTESSLIKEFSDLWTFFNSRDAPAIFQFTPECLAVFNNWADPQKEKWWRFSASSRRGNTPPPRPALHRHYFHRRGIIHVNDTGKRDRGDRCIDIVEGVRLDLFCREGVKDVSDVEGPFHV